MAIRMKTAEEIAAKWAEVTPGRAPFYEAEAGAAGADWLRETQAAAPAFKASVQATDIDKRFAGGARRAGAEKFERHVRGKGKDRYAGGVREGQADMATGFAPYIPTLTGLTLPQRKPRGDEANAERSKVVQQALAKRRIALKTAGG